MLTHRTPHQFGLLSFWGVRSTNPESIHPPTPLPDGFRALASRAGMTAVSYATISFNTFINASGAVTFGA